jgi:pantetheine-phosphate adenylyltransferase
MPNKYQKVALGGTFDRLHRGHEHLIALAAAAAPEIVIGVTDDEMVKHKTLSHLINPYETRVKQLNDYLDNRYPTHKISLITLNDPFGSTLTDPTIEAVVVSPLTMSGAQKLNDYRVERGLAPLKIEEADLVTDESGEHLSSTRIRQGLVNRQGLVYRSLFQSDLQLTPTQIEIIRQPQGDLVDLNNLRAELPEDKMIALVGDQVTEYFATHDLPFRWAVIDYQIGRQPHNTDLGKFKASQCLKVTNPGGTIASAASRQIYDLPTDQPVLVEVEGEEDLMGFPVALSLPLGSLLFYGQPGQGMIKIELTEVTKDRLAKIIMENPSH